MAQHPMPVLTPLTIYDNDDDEELGLSSDDVVSSIPSFAGIPLKHISLVTLAVQNSMLTLIMHHSRVSTPPSRTYSAATAVLVNEVLKGLISLVIAYSRIDSPPYSDGSQAAGLSWALKTRSSMFRIRKLGKDVFSPDCWKLSIPAILYVIQNNLQYVAASNLDAATFQVTYQMKILTTAGFSVLLLRKKLNSSQWLALLFLAIGVGIVQIQAGEARGAIAATTAAVTASADVQTMNALKGFMAVASACFTSGLAGVYFEMVLKNSQTDLWVRNVQLSLFSLLPALAPILVSHPALGPNGPWFTALFRHFGVWAWATVAVQVLGGLVTAMVIKYSDNILKGFATSLSIVISFLASVVLFRFRMTFTFVLGSGIVLGATWLYNHPPKRNAIAAGLLSADVWSVTPRNEKFRAGGLSPNFSRTPTPLALGRTTSSTTSLASLSSISSVLSSPPLFDAAKEKSSYFRP